MVLIFHMSRTKSQKFNLPKDMLLTKSWLWIKPRSNSKVIFLEGKGEISGSMEMLTQTTQSPCLHEQQKGSLPVLPAILAKTYLWETTADVIRKEPALSNQLRPWRWGHEDKHGCLDCPGGKRQSSRKEGSGLRSTPRRPAKTTKGQGRFPVGLQWSSWTLPP